MNKGGPKNVIQKYTSCIADFLISNFGSTISFHKAMIKICFFNQN